MEQEAKKKHNTDMTPEDIRKTYLEAANKREQIKILSERNLCSREAIREILIEQGIPEDELPKPRGRGKKPEEKPKSAEETKLEKKEEKKPDAAGKAEKKPDAAVRVPRPPQAVLDVIAKEIDKLMAEILEKKEKLAVLHAFLISAKGADNDVESL